VHARAQVEKGVKWINDKSEVEGEEAKEYWLCWVTTYIYKRLFIRNIYKYWCNII
jgi:hypothetical protein